MSEATDTLFFKSWFKEEEQWYHASDAVAKALQSARREAIEEAAKVADMIAHDPTDPTEIGDAIRRQLSGPSEGKG